MPVSQPSLIVEGFGTGDGSKTYPIPLASQIGTTPGAASYADGFPPLTRTALDAGGIPPSGEDMNGILYTVSAHIAYINSGGQQKYDGTYATAIGGYGVGAVLLSANNNGYWLNAVANNTADPDAASAYAGWYPVADFTGEYVDGTSSGTHVVAPWQAGVSLIAFNGVLTGNITIQLPRWFGKNWILASYATHNGFTIAVQTTVAGTNIFVPPGGYPQAQGVFVGDDGNLWSNNVSTAGLAPINSPALTGTPTTPTAAGNSNTTQIASTAQVQAAIALAIAGLAPLASPTLTGVPTVPTAALGTNTAQIASTAFVTAAIAAQRAAPIIHTGDFTSASGVVNVAFGVTFPSVPRVFVQWRYAAPDVGWIVPGSETTTGFQYQSGNAGLCHYSAQLGNF